MLHVRGYFRGLAARRRPLPLVSAGARVEGWAGERWLDIRKLDILRPLMEARMDLCKRKGFDAIEPDNVDGYVNRSGFPLTAEDQLRYNIWLATAAHARGLSVGLKNDLEQTERLVTYFDWAVRPRRVVVGSRGTKSNGQSPSPGLPDRAGSRARRSARAPRAPPTSVATMAAPVSIDSITL